MPLCHFSSKNKICPEYTSEEINRGPAARGYVGECEASACESLLLISVCKQQQQRLGSGDLHICHALALYGPPEGSLSSSVDQVMLLLVMDTFSEPSSVARSRQAFQQGDCTTRSGQPSFRASPVLFFKSSVPILILCKNQHKGSTF